MKKCSTFVLFTLLYQVGRIVQRLKVIIGYGRKARETFLGFGKNSVCYFAR